MVLPIVKYGEPVLRQKGARIEKLTGEVAALISDMFETMAEAAGVGLAAQQVGHALQLMVLDVRGASKERPSKLWLDEQESDVAAFMPLALINPEITPVGAYVVGPEGCLSFPEVYGDIDRPEAVEVRGLNQNFEPVQFRCAGLLARAIQHENDHLQGILFIDRMDRKTKLELKPEIDLIQAETKALLKKKKSVRS